MTALSAPLGLSVASAQARRESAAERVSCFAVEAHADPGVLSRVVQLLAKRGLVPDRCVVQRHGRHGDCLLIDMQVAGLDPAVSDLVARSLRQIPTVTAVLTSDKLRA